MKTIICKFKSDGTVIRKTAVINDSLDTLSKSKRNEATDIIEPDTRLPMKSCSYMTRRTASRH